MIDRSSPPVVEGKYELTFPAYETLKLSNGIPVYCIAIGFQPIIELQVVFPAGFCYEKQTGATTVLGRMITEGTEEKNSLQIAQLLDALGASIDFNTGYERTTISMSTLAQTGLQSIDLLYEIITQSVIPDDEFKLQVQRIEQNLKVEEKKPSYHARRLFMEKLFGHSHPYASFLTRERLLKLEANHLREYLESNFQPEFIVIAGNFDAASILQKIEATFGSISLKDNIEMLPFPKIISEKSIQNYPISDTVQSTIRIGHIGTSRDNKDYHAMRLITTLLGGFFGSRLTKNIREDKGYTYGIGSSWNCMRNSGYLIIATDTAHEYVLPLIAEVRREIDRLQSEKMAEEELEIGKNYLLGRIISELETPAQVADTLRYYLSMGLTIEDMYTGFRQMQELTTEDIMALSRQYYHPELLLEVVAGANLLQN
jgi:predicted Zn-dependent peptidase